MPAFPPQITEKTPSDTRGTVTTLLSCKPAPRELRTGGLELRDSQAQGDPPPSRPLTARPWRAGSPGYGAWVTEPRLWSRGFTASHLLRSFSYSQGPQYHTSRVSAASAGEPGNHRTTATEEWKTINRKKHTTVQPQHKPITTLPANSTAPPRPGRRSGHTAAAGPRAAAPRGGLNPGGGENVINRV